MEMAAGRVTRRCNSSRATNSVPAARLNQSRPPFPSACWQRDSPRRFFQSGRYQGGGAHAHRHAERLPSDGPRHFRAGWQAARGGAHRGLLQRAAAPRRDQCRHRCERRRGDTGLGYQPRHARLGPRKAMPPRISTMPVSIRTKPAASSSQNPGPSLAA